MMKDWLWSGKPWQAFKNFAILFSFVMNITLLILLFVVVLLIVPSLHQIAAPAVSGLNKSFADISQAHIVREIRVQDEIPVQFELPISMQTRATIVEGVPMALPTNFVFPGSGGAVNGTVFFEMPAGVELPVQLSLTVPVSQVLPVDINVAVDIPMEDTELNQPFSDIRTIFSPIERFLSELPDSNFEAFKRLVGAGSSSETKPAELTSHN